MFGRPKYLTESRFRRLSKGLEGGHWVSRSNHERWLYHKSSISLLRKLGLKNSHSVLEIGTMGIKCVGSSDTLDYLDRWDFPGKDPTFAHDARMIPWPIPDKAYDFIIALRVFQHLAPKQREAFAEARRVSRHVILVAPATYDNEVLPNARGIRYEEFVDFCNGYHPNYFEPTPYGDLYHWDTLNPTTRIHPARKRF